MRVETIVSNNNNDLAKRSRPDADIVLYFISPDYPHDRAAYLAALKSAYPKARLVGCSTGGEIGGDEVLLKSAVSAAVKLERSQAKVASARVGEAAESYDAGKQLAMQLDDPALRLVFVLADGLNVNGTELVRGITGHLGKDVILTGGLAADGSNFKQTGVGIDALPEKGVLAAIGFYGDKMKVSYGSVGGFLKFGPERQITRSKGNILYELDGKPALDLYKKYLGDEAKNLPGSALLFPLSIRPTSESKHSVVRCIVATDDNEKTMVFGANIPEGYTAQLMHGNIESLTDGAANAASLALKEMDGCDRENSLGILVSCIGRSLLMGQHVSNEVDAIREILGGVPLVGFYSYGEICPHPLTRQCDLHNQTMTITLVSEAA